MDAIFAKINHIWLLYHLIRSTTEVQKQNKIYIFKCYTIQFIFPILHRPGHSSHLNAHPNCHQNICDNFNIKGWDKEPDEEDYSVTPFTGYMIFCGAWLPLMSSACYIILIGSCKCLGYLTMRRMQVRR